MVAASCQHTCTQHLPKHMPTSEILLRLIDRRLALLLCTIINVLLEMICRCIPAIEMVFKSLPRWAAVVVIIVSGQNEGNGGK